MGNIRAVRSIHPFDARVLTAYSSGLEPSSHAYHPSLNGSNGDVVSRDNFLTGRTEALSADPVLLNSKQELLFMMPLHVMYCPLGARRMRKRVAGASTFRCPLRQLWRFDASSVNLKGAPPHLKDQVRPEQGLELKAVVSSIQETSVAITCQWYTQSYWSIRVSQLGTRMHTELYYSTPLTLPVVL